MTAELPQPSEVSAVVCTKNSIASVGPCLQSLRNAGTGEIIVVDASSTDGTHALADSLADRVLQDARRAATYLVAPLPPWRAEDPRPAGGRPTGAGRFFRPRLWRLLVCVARTL